MVDIKEMYHVKWLLRQKFGLDIGSLVFPFLRYFVRNWHAAPPRFLRKPPVWLTDEKQGRLSNPHWSARTVTFTSAEQFYKMAKMNFRLTIYHPQLFSPPYSYLYESWKKEIGTEEAMKLVSYYSYKNDQTKRYHTDVLDWTDEAYDWLTKQFIVHAEDVALDFELTEAEKQQHAPTTIMVNLWMDYYNKLQKLRKRTKRKTIS